MDTELKEKTGNKIKRVDEKELSTPADFTSPEVLYQKLMEAIKAYHPSTDLSMMALKPEYQTGPHPHTLAISFE